MLIAFAKSMTMTGGFGMDQVVRSEPYPVGGANYLEITLNVEAWYENGAPANAMITAAVERSNDGVRFEPIAGLEVSEGAALGMITDSGDVSAAFIRIKYTLAMDNQGWAATTFDLHGNLTHK